MRAEIDRDGCISCGLCPDTCPEVFEMEGGGPARVIVSEIPKEAEERAEEAADGCPVSVITVS